MKTLTLVLFALLLAACGTAKGATKGTTTYTPFDCPAPRTVQACMQEGR